MSDKEKTKDLVASVAMNEQVMNSDLEKINKAIDENNEKVRGLQALIQTQILERERIKGALMIIQEIKKGGSIETE